MSFLSVSVYISGAGRDRSRFFLFSSAQRIFSGAVPDVVAGCLPDFRTCTCKKGKSRIPARLNPFLSPCGVFRVKQRLAVSASNPVRIPCFQAFQYGFPSLRFLAISDKTKSERKAKKAEKEKEPKRKRVKKVKETCVFFKTL